MKRHSLTEQINVKFTSILCQNFKIRRFMLSVELMKGKIRVDFLLKEIVLVLFYFRFMFFFP